MSSRASATRTQASGVRVPKTMPAWLAGELLGGGARGDDAIQKVERDLTDAVTFMNQAGLFHFDAHLGNVLADGHRLILVDFGLAAARSFHLAADELAFLDTNRAHDRCHALTSLVNWLVTALTGAPDWRARNETIQRVAAGDSLAGVSPAASPVIARHAPVAAVVNDFYRQLHLLDRRVPFPAAEVARASGQTH